MSWGNVIRTQYLIPLEYDKIYTVSAFLGAIANLIFNLIFIPKLYSIGACIGTVIAEFIVMFYQTFKIRNHLPFKKYIKQIIPFFLKSLLMFLIINIFNYLEINIYFKILIQVSLGIMIYFVLNIKYINSIINFKKIFDKKKEVSI